MVWIVTLIYNLISLDLQMAQDISKNLVNILTEWKQRSISTGLFLEKL